jgi:hypothetical protein
MKVRQMTTMSEFLDDGWKEYEADGYAVLCELLGWAFRDLGATDEECSDLDFESAYDDLQAAYCRALVKVAKGSRFEQLLPSQIIADSKIGEAA